MCQNGTMNLTSYVSNLGREFAALAEAGGEEARALVERLAGPLESAIRMTLLDALSAAADEITRDLAPGSVELRLRGRDPNFVVTLPPAEPLEFAAEDAAPTPGGAPDIDLLISEDSPAARINVRLPEQLKAAIEEAAAKEGRSVNAWLARAAAASLQPSGRDQRLEPRGSGKRAKQGFTGWVR
jgi:HicB family